MKKTIIALVIVILACIIGFVDFYIYDRNNSQSLTAVSSSPKVCILDTCFDVTVAKTEPEREKGLMNVHSMPEMSGMIFVFENTGIYPFWMKNTMIPLDMIWIDENNKIVYIQKNAQGCKSDPCEIFNPKISAKYVFEINGGLSDKYRLKLGDKVDLNNF